MFARRTLAMGIGFLRLCRYGSLYRRSWARLHRCPPSARRAACSLDRIPQIAPTWRQGRPRRDIVRGHSNENNHGRMKVTQARHKLLNGCTCCGPVVTLGRREFVAGGLAALGLGAFAASGIDARAQTPAKPHRIDVHHHISPPTWLDAVKKAKLDNPPMANWSPQKSLDDMDQAGIATAIVSPTTPQVNFLDHAKDAAARIPRESNEYANTLLSDR